MIRLVAIAGHFQPRGGNPFPPEVERVLSAVPAVTPAGLLTHVMPFADGAVCLDFGCGSGPHRSLIEGLGLRYVGLDYAASIDPARQARRGSPFDGEVIEYDGLTIPLEDAAVDLVWAWSSLEHCIYPERALAEIARVTRPGGLLAGSVPHTCTYHAESTVNYSPWGFYLACRRNGFAVETLVPHMDGPSFALKDLALALGITADPVPIDQIFRNAPLLAPLLSLFDGYEERIRLSLHAQLCGEFGFIVRRERSTSI